MKDNNNDNTILLLGDGMQDVYYICDPPTRYSAEVASLPINTVKEVKVYPGGAANVAYNLQMFGWDVHEIYGFTREFTVPQKCRVYSAGKQVCRFDVNDKVDAIYAEELAVRLTDHKYRAVVVVDYGKGSIDGKIIYSIARFCHETKLPLYVHTKYDPSQWWMSEDNITMFCNLKEFNAKFDSYIRFNRVVRTLGKDGMDLLSKGIVTEHLDAYKSPVIDVNGAGDVVMAAFVTKDLGNSNVAKDPKQVLEYSSIAASIGVSKPFTSFTNWREVLNEWNNPTV